MQRAKGTALVLQSLRRLSESKPFQSLPLLFSTSTSTSTFTPLSDSNSTPNSISNPKSLTQDSVLYILKTLAKKPPKALEFFNHVTSSSGFKPGPAAYSLMLRILGGHRDHVADFWLLLKSMDSAGHPLDNGTYLTLLPKFKSLKMPAELSALTRFYNNKAKESAADEPVQCVSKIVLQDSSSGSSHDFEEEAGKKLQQVDNFAVSEISVAKVLREARSSPLKALGFFRWAAAQGPGYKHGSVAYNAMARVLGKEDSIKEFWELVEEMKGVGVEMDIDTYVKLLRQFLKSKMTEEAVKLYEFMMDGPYKPDVQDCGMLLRQISLSGAPDLQLVSRVVNKYEATGHALSKVVYDGIHRALTSNGRFDEADEIMRRMREAGYQPDNITYSQLVYGLCKAKRLDEACKVLDEMEEEGCVPDLKTWTVLIQGHCMAGEVDKACECLTKMIEKGRDADGDLLDILVRGLCGQRRVDGAFALLTEMVTTARLRPWQATYKYLIPELLRERRLEEAFKVLVSMKSHKYPPFADPFPPYISKFGTVEDAHEFLKALSVKAYPSSTAYLHVFKSFFDEGRYTEAQDLLFKCPHHIRKHADISELFGSIKVESNA